MRIRRESSAIPERGNRTLSSNFICLLTAILIIGCASSPATKAGAFTQTTDASLASFAGGELLEAQPLEREFPYQASKMLPFSSSLLTGAIINMELLDRKGYAEWRKSRLPTMQNVEGFRIAFCARLPEGGTERQSGMVFLPEPEKGKGRELTWLIYLKGTELKSDLTPSRGKYEEMPFILSAAALGYAVWVPDYAGMGDGQGVQEYCVAESLADSALDGLCAARAWLANSRMIEAGYSESGRLAIIGYSEGGLAAMATVAALADHRLEAPGLALQAVYPMGAPLNMGIFVPHLGSGPFLIEHPEYQIALAVGWHRAYPSEFELEDVLRPRTLERIVPLFDGRTSAARLRRQIVACVGKKKDSVTDSDLFTSEYCAALRSEPETVGYYRR